MCGPTRVGATRACASRAQPRRFRLRRVVPSSRLARACASARVGAHTQVERDDGTITGRDETCLRLRLASRVCTVGPESGVRRRHRQSRCVTGSASASASAGCVRCLYVQTRGQELALCTCTTGYRALTGGVRLAHGFAVGDLQGVGPVSAGEADGATGRAPRAPNSVLRGIRVNERHESQSEFAEAMARVARDMGVEVYPDGQYVQRLESGHITWPHRTYRNILEQLCGRPARELGFAPSARPASNSGEISSRVNMRLREAVWESGKELDHFARKIGVDPKTAERWITRGVIPQPFRRWKASLILGIDESELWPDAIPHQEMPTHRLKAPKAINGLIIGVTPPNSSNVPVSVLVQASTADAAKITKSAGSELIAPLAMEQFFEEVQRLSIAYNASTAGVDRQVLEKATELRSTLQKLTAAYREPSQATDLYLMIGLLSGICSYACLDLGYPEEAMAQARAIFMMGDLVGHDGLRAWALGTRSLIARFQGRYPEALGYVRRGLQYATSGTALVRLRCGEGQTLANMGDAANAIDALNLAKEARENVSSADVANGLFTFSEAKQTYYSGSSLQWLSGDKNATAAEAESMRAIQMFQQASPENRSLADELLAHVYLGNSRLTLGEIEGSMEALRPVLDLPVLERNSWQRKRMHQIASRLEKANFSDSRLAISARDEISAFIEVPE
jgi:tetratricopeptide (TPR) repeat protein